ncbi:Forkhead-associated protein [Planctopirus limnophila DSM 3776]|uniref:Forkhead-associated protein n=1 Tax=Planctopirus limnophila (strain ATCC 43296 / DSM 3776 / IFAM 1008 / Mu 290) TaxID=521674 RepID=D5SQ47_PLAL2|nr:FHA domain-containing protein [Planctopirus limnophila]ADG68422.1 Forkhead-associated protein [Planctopirus limnophila DSM 3776]
MLKAELKILVGKHQGKVIPLAARKFLVGREQDCHLRPNSDLVSRHHCVFTIDDYAVRLRDLGSTNGTQVNGENIRGEVILNEGDQVTIGKLELQLLLKTEASIETQSAAEARQGTAALGTAVHEENAARATLELANFSMALPVDTAAQDTSYEMVAYTPEVTPVATGDTAIVGSPPPPLAPAPPPGYANVGAPPQGYPPQPYPAGMPQYQNPQYPGMTNPGMGYPNAGYPAASYPPAGYPQGMYPAGYPMPGYPQQAYPGGPVYPGQSPAYPQTAPMPGYAPQPVETPQAQGPSAGVVPPPIRLPNPEETGAVEVAPPPAAGGPSPSKTEKPSDKAGDIIKQYLNRRGGR